MPLYHFSLGNSSRGSIGFAAAIRAESGKAAAARLADIVGDYENGLDVRIDDRQDSEYVEVYFNSRHVTARSIDGE